MSVSVRQLLILSVGCRGRRCPQGEVEILQLVVVDVTSANNAATTSILSLSFSVAATQQILSVTVATVIDRIGASP